MNAIRRWLQTRTGRLVTHDGVIALGVGYAAWDAGGHNLTWGALTAAGLVAGKAFLRLLLPVPATEPATTPRRRTHKAAGYGAFDTLIFTAVFVVVVLLIVFLAEHVH